MHGHALDCSWNNRCMCIGRSPEHRASAATRRDPAGPNVHGGSSRSPATNPLGRSRRRSGQIRRKRFGKSHRQGKRATWPSAPEHLPRLLIGEVQRSDCSCLSLRLPLFSHKTTVTSHATQQLGRPRIPRGHFFIVPRIGAQERNRTAPLLRQRPPCDCGVRALSWPNARCLCAGGAPLKSGNAC